MTENGKVSDEEILSTMCDEILREDWLPGVVAATAHRVGLAPSTVARRFNGTEDGLRQALIGWVLDAAGVEGNDWPEQLAQETVDRMAAQDTVSDALTVATALNWELVESDDRMFMQMLLWSRIRDDLRLRSKMQAQYAGYDRIHRNLWSDVMNHLRERTGKPMIQRRGLTDRHFLIMLDAMVEGFMLRSKAEPSLPIAEIYAAALKALVIGAIDIDGDLMTIEEKLEGLVATRQAPA